MIIKGDRSRAVKLISVGFKYLEDSLRETDKIKESGIYHINNEEVIKYKGNKVINPSQENIKIIYNYCMGTLKLSVEGD